ncbi:MGH1-like glycoside hydrolase domain-containing protein [Flagellimonas meishanensis]|uniref:MGH1-like glycoside hydrolase domain-containing protein n=1 Tax=Flagellimonas meishanensis TaxID=2873264 RepID=UPI001CA70128|nr:trehalase family glycosidase [[Muricauda] meishanensis]
MERRDFYKTLGLATLGSTVAISCKDGISEEVKSATPLGFQVTPELSERMYAKALEITKSKVRGGDSETFFKKPFVDAAFSDNIFLWDSCFIACFAKYHMDELPVYQALDNFYERMEEDGYICREYRKDGRPLWSKEHPVSINPPLLGLAETEIYNLKQDKDRLRYAYPFLKKNFEFLVNTYQGEDKLFWGDTLGMGMDNIPRSPRNWTTDEGNGMTHHELGDKLGKMGGSTAEERLNMFIADYVETLQGVWNKQGRLVDFTAQMAMLSKQLHFIAKEIGRTEDLGQYAAFHQEVKEALNQLCWDDQDAFYYDLGYGKQIKRKHIGMYWTLLGELVPEDKLDAFVAHLTNQDEFYRKIPLPALSADDPDYKGWGDYWLGGVWAPTSYMVLKGLSVVGKDDLAQDLAEKTYSAIAEVFDATDTFWENYAPDLISYGMPAKKDFCGWTGLVPIAMYHEYIKT